MRVLPRVTGLFVVHTGDVRGHRSVVKQHTSGGKVTEDTLMRRIDIYGLVSPTKAKNVVWCFFRKYDIKKIKEKHGGNDILKLDQHALCMLCYKDPDPDQRLKVTVKLGKDYSPTVMLEHMMHHHKQEYAAVVIANSKGQSLASFTAGRQQPRVLALLEGSGSIAESPEQMPTPGNAEGAALHAGTMARHTERVH